MQIRPFAAFAAVAFLLGTFGPAPAARAAPFEVQGVITADGRPLAGALLRLTALPDPGEEIELLFSGGEPRELARTKSGRDGSFALAGPDEGFYRLVVAADGYLAAEYFPFLAERPARPWNFELQPARQVTLAVAGPDGRPLAGARIRAAFADPMAGAFPWWPAFTATGAEGGATLAIPRDRAADLWVAAAGVAPRKVSFAPGGAGRATVALGPGAELAALVMGGTPKKPLAGAAIVLAESGLAIGLTGQDGRAILRCEPGQTELEFFDAAGHRGREALPPPPAAPAAGAPWRVELEEPRELRGEVVELPSREPLAEAWLVVWERLPRVARSGPGGEFELRLEPHGNRELMAMKSGYHSAQQSISESSPALVIGLAAAGRVAGRVLDDAGRPVAQAQVKLEIELSATSFRVEGAGADDEGRFALDEAAVNTRQRIQAELGERRSSWLELAPLAAGESRQVELLLPAGESFSLHIVDPEGRGIAGAELVAAAQGRFREITYGALANWPELRKGKASAVADGEGRIVLAGLGAGKYDVAVRAKGFAAQLRRGIQVGEGGEDGEAPAPEPIVLQPAALARGRVVGDDGRGIAGAELRLRLAEPGERGGFSSGHEQPPAVAASGAAGDFTFAEVAEGQLFDLWATKEGYAPALLAGVALAGGQPLLLRMGPAGRLRGRILSRGKPLPHVWVRLEPLDDASRMVRSWRELQLGASTDAAGGFAIDGLAVGRYQLEADGPPGLQNFRSSPFTVGPGETRARDIELAAAALIYGRVLLPSGEPAPEAQVSYVPGADPEGSWNDNAFTDAFGAYRLEGASAGVGWLRTRVRGYREVVRKVVATEGDNEVDLRLEGGSAVLAGRVVDPDGQPIAGVRVSLSAEAVRGGGQPLFVFGATGADGQVSFAALESGTYRVGLDKKGYASSWEKVALEEGDPGHEWRMRRASTRLRGALLGLGPGESADLFVRVRSDAGFQVAGRVEGGRYELDSMAAGSWTVIASSPRTGIVLATPVEIGESEREAELNLDFSRLAGPWRGEIRKGGEPVHGLEYSLWAPGQSRPLESATSQNGRIVIRAAPGKYRLDFFLPPELVRYLDIEIGPPSEQTIELVVPPGP